MLSKPSSPISLALEYPSLLALFFTIFLFFFSSLVKKCNTSKSNSSIQKLPPGPKKLPFIGNLHQLRGATNSLLHQVFTNLAKKYGPIMHLQLGETSAVVISSPEIAEEVLKTKEQYFAQRPQFLAAEVMSYNGSSIVFSPYNEYWKHTRKICVMEVLSAQRIQKLKSGREEEVWNLMESIKLSEGQTINLNNIIYSLTHNMISRATVGKKFEYQEEFTSTLKEVITLAASFGLDDLFPSLRFIHFVTGKRASLERAHKKMDKILESIVKEHKARRKAMATHDGGKPGEEDLVDVLLKIQENDGSSFTLTTNNIKAIILDIFGAGSETSATVLVWVMTELLRNSRVMKKAQSALRDTLKGKTKIYEEDIQEISYLNLIIKETMRLHFPGPLLPRQSREACEIHGYHIPPKTTILINAYAMTRDPKYWHDPENFQPERFSDPSLSSSNGMEYIPFGAGRRICPGSSFASTSIKLALAQLLYHFDWKIPGDVSPEELDMTEVFQITTRRKNDLYAIPIAYKP